MAKKKLVRGKDYFTLGDLKREFLREHGKDLMGLAEVAEHLNVRRQRVANWMTRRKDFPKPLAVLKMGPVWNVKEILQWRLGPGLKLCPLSSN